MASTAHKLLSTLSLDQCPFIQQWPIPSREHFDARAVPLRERFDRRGETVIETLAFVNISRETKRGYRPKNLR